MGFFGKIVDKVYYESKRKEAFRDWSKEGARNENNE